MSHNTVNGSGNRLLLSSAKPTMEMSVRANTHWMVSKWYSLGNSIVKSENVLLGLADLESLDDKYK